MKIGKSGLSHCQPKIGPHQRQLWEEKKKEKKAVGLLQKTAALPERKRGTRRPKASLGESPWFSGGGAWGFALGQGGTTNAAAPKDSG